VNGSSGRKEHLDQRSCSSSDAGVIGISGTRSLS